MIVYIYFQVFLHNLQSQQNLIYVLHNNNNNNNNIIQMFEVTKIII